MLTFKLKSGMQIESKLTNRSLIGLGQWPDPGANET